MFYKKSKISKKIFSKSKDKLLKSKEIKLKAKCKRRQRHKKIIPLQYGKIQ